MSNLQLILHQTMAASQSECLAISGNENGESSGLINDAHEMGHDPRPINPLSSGQELNSGIINQYGQLMGEYSKLDDELWLPKSEDDDDALEFCYEFDSVTFVSFIDFCSNFSYHFKFSY